MLPLSFARLEFKGLIEFKVCKGQPFLNWLYVYIYLFFTLLGFLCSYRGIYSIFPSNQFPFNNPL
jgi:hypothetical protein